MYIRLLSFAKLSTLLIKKGSPKRYATFTTLAAVEHSGRSTSSLAVQHLPLLFNIFPCWWALTIYSDELSKSETPADQIWLYIYTYIYNKCIHTYIHIRIYACMYIYIYHIYYIYKYIIYINKYINIYIYKYMCDILYTSCAQVHELP